MESVSPSLSDRSRIGSVAARASISARSWSASFCRSTPFLRARGARARGRVTHVRLRRAHACRRATGWHAPAGRRGRGPRRRDLVV
eukprot:4754223-Prymnesium_polylepis.1